MRYDDEQYLKDWQAGKGYPKIHDAIWGLIEKYAVGTNYVDLCCSTGMLGTRIVEQLRKPCIGVESLQTSIDQGHEYLIPMPVYCLRIAPATLPALESLLSRHHVNTVVARRCVSEFLSDGRRQNRPFAHAFTAMLKRVGVKQIFVQGRQPSVKATHPVPDVAAEVSLLEHGGHYKQQILAGQCALLELA